MLKKWLNEFPVVTALLGLGFLFYAAAGLVEVYRGHLTFDDYGKHLGIFAGSLGLLGVGRGIQSSKLASKTTLRRTPAEKPPTKRPPAKRR